MEVNLAQLISKGTQFLDASQRGDKMAARSSWQSLDRELFNTSVRMEREGMGHLTAPFHELAGRSDRANKARMSSGYPSGGKYDLDKAITQVAKKVDRTTVCQAVRAAGLGKDISWKVDQSRLNDTKVCKAGEKVIKTLEDMGLGEITAPIRARCGNESCARMVEVARAKAKTHLTDATLGRFAANGLGLEYWGLDDDSVPARKMPLPAASSGIMGDDPKQESFGTWAQWEAFCSWVMPQPAGYLPQPSERTKHILPKEGSTGLYYRYRDAQTRNIVTGIYICSSSELDRIMPKKPEPDPFQTAHLRLLKVIMDDLHVTQHKRRGEKFLYVLGFALAPDLTVKINSCANLASTGDRALHPKMQRALAQFLRYLCGVEAKLQ